MDSELHKDLLKDYSSMLYDSEDHDVIIQVGEDHNTKDFRIHSNILRARSPYFRNELSTKWGSNNSNNFKRGYTTMLKKPHISPNVFEIILKYIYTGEADLCKKSGEDIFGVLITSAEFLLEKLFNYVQDHIIKKQTIWIKQNFAYVFYTTFKLENCEKLQDYCMECMSEDPQLFTSKNFPSLEEDILYNLLKRDDLQIEEIVAWDFLINWGIEQISGLGSDRTDWSEDDYEALKGTISQFIPLIRFMDISPADFYDKVRPYKPAIPLHIYEELEEFYYKKTLSKTEILPPRIGKLKIESNLINSKLANIIASWIDKKDLNNISSSDKYNFDLLYRGSEDGINSKSFRVKCNYRGSCLVLVKKKKSTEIYGGYNPIGFTNSNRKYPASDSFIFSFENGEDIQNMKISRVNSKCINYAICEQHNNGFNFGNTFYFTGGHVFFGNSDIYDNIGNVSELNMNPIPEEIEVFKVTCVKKK
ncbi:uncharacterized protein OCT59_005987 [Rhizophagus irregularis]|nr:hypothetical protein OCT59_005987 [Rhizophagus irregularis]GBC38248.2 hypothetical protein GLOIN_2v1722037 [Rhizophagus irregularis DAOM 181602=DAOM 197198]